MVDKLLNGALSSVDAQVRLPIGHESLIIESFHLQAIGGQRPPAINWNARHDGREWHVKPHNCTIAQHQLTVRRIYERPAAGGDDRAAQVEQLDQLRAFAGAEIGLTLLSKDRRDVATLLTLDSVVDVFDAPVETPAQGTSSRALTRSHEANQIDLVGLHTTTRRRSSKKVGYDTATASAPSIVVTSAAPRAATAKAIASR